ncbi:MAG: beta-glucosidase [Muribaculaceae bacterium]|nr:beta-glucosidase [Muribaculaceae bacterium]
MLKNFFIASLAFLAVACGNRSSQQGTPAVAYDSDLESQVKKIVSGLSLEEKVGQMCEVTIDEVQCDSLVNGQVVLDTAKVNKVIGEYKVGSVLNVPMGMAQTPETWCRIIEGIQMASMKYIGIPDVYGVDQNHGSTYTQGGTLFPQEINMAASLNRELVREGAIITAYEARACNIPWVYNPVMDLGRNQAWSRIWESFGEDPYINSVMAVEMVKGYQGDDNNHLGPKNVGACLKHYMAYGNPVSGQDRTPSSVNMIDMREKYFAPYKAAIQAGALSVMVNSALNNGIPMHVNHELLTVWLKEQLNWDGLIVTDWADIHNVWKRDKVAADYKEAIEKAINAGIDMSMTPNDVEFCTLLKELVDEGKVPMSRIDDAVSRIIRFKLRLGLFETPNTFYKDYPLLGSTEFANKALELAVQSEVLLKNNKGVLPLGAGKRILVTGPNANSMRCLNGGWSYTWQGTNNPMFHEQYNTIYEAMCQEFGTANVILEEGMDYVEDFGQWEKEVNVRIDRAVAAASRGENSDAYRVRGFDKINLKPGESKKIEFLIAASDLAFVNYDNAFVNYDNRWTLEAGEFEFTVGSLKTKATCSATKVWNTPNI